MNIGALVRAILELVYPFEPGRDVVNEVMERYAELERTATGDKLSPTEKVPTYLWCPICKSTDLDSPLDHHPNCMFSGGVSPEAMVGVFGKEVERLRLLAAEYMGKCNELEAKLDAIEAAKAGEPKMPVTYWHRGAMSHASATEVANWGRLGWDTAAALKIELADARAQELEAELALAQAQERERIAQLLEGDDNDLCLVHGDEQVEAYEHALTGESLREALEGK